MKLYVHRVEGIGCERPILAPWVEPDDAGWVRLRPALQAAGVTAVADLAEADVAGLPVLWGKYRGPARVAAIQMIEEAGRAGRPVAVWVGGDEEVDLPWPHVIQFQHAFRRSRHRVTTSYAYPTFFSDIVEVVFDGDISPRPKGERPIVGFCGQARSSTADEAKRVLWKAQLHARWRLHRTDLVPESFASHLRLRRQVLATLDRDPRVETNFVVRDQYRAGLSKHRDTAEELDRSSQGFFENIRSAHYTVCVRGGGNFSVRLYETLCLGRIPLIIDADGLLPWVDHPFWTETALIVDRRDLGSLADRLVAHHASADEDGWRERQEEARRFWRERLSRPGFLTHLPELLG